MPWSRSYLPKDVAEHKVMEFTPQKIDMGTPSQAMEYVQRKVGSDFRMNEHVQVVTGVDVIEQNSTDERVEQRALELLAQIQENAYKEAYQMGLEEGRKKAFDEVAVQIEENMTGLVEVLTSISSLKEELVSQNEAHLVKLLYHMASRIAGTYLEKADDAVVNVLRSAVSLAQDEEDVRVEMHPQQIEFVEELRQKSGREFEFLKKIRLQPNDKIRPGGCTLETNYGEIDARVETRLEQLWATLGDAVPKVKNRING